MEDQKILLQLDDIFSKELKQPDIKLKLTSTANDVAGWTSLIHMMLIDAIETHFKIRFKLNEIMKFNNVGEMVACIHKKLAK